MRRLVSMLVVLALPLAAAQDWALFRSGPFEVYSGAGNRDGRLVLNELEQLRNALRLTLGRDEMHSTWPIRLVVFDSGGAARAYPLGSLKLSRDAWIGAIVKEQPVPIRALVRVLLDSNTARMPASVERGLVAVFSTLSVDRTIVTLGEPVPPAGRDADWALIHMATTTDQYGGRAPAFFANLQNGADWYAACRNAFSKTPDELTKEAAAYLAAGQFGTRKISGAPIDPERDFRAHPLDDLDVQLALADLLDPPASQAAYNAVLAAHPDAPGALEGLGRYADAIAHGSKNARTELAYGLTLEDKAQAGEAFRKAAELNPAWGEPDYRLAMIESNPAQKSRLLTKATELSPRQVDYWKELALTYLSTDNYREAGRAWAGAETAAVDEAERKQIEEARSKVEQQRADYLAEQQRLEKEKREQELARVKQEMMARIHAAEEEANAGAPAVPAGKVVPWWDDPRPRKKVVGTLERVECKGGSLRLQVKQYDGAAVTLSVPDPARVVLMGGSGQETLVCGPVTPPRNVQVEYFAEEKPAAGVIGEAASIDFR